MARRQADSIKGQLLPWNAVLAILEDRDLTKTQDRLHARSRQLIEECAEREYAMVVGNFIYGGD